MVKAVLILRQVVGCGSSSVAERQLPKLNVAGSIPVSRSMHSEARDFQLAELGAKGGTRTPMDCSARS